MTTQDQRPLPVGTRLIYYNMQQCREMEAIVKDAGYAILWIIDQEHSKQDEHFISYKDIVQVIEVAECKRLCNSRNKNRAEIFYSITPSSHGVARVAMLLTKIVWQLIIWIDSKAP